MVSIVPVDCFTCDFDISPYLYNALFCLYCQDTLFISCDDNGKTFLFLALFSSKHLTVNWEIIVLMIGN